MDVDIEYYCNCLFSSGRVPSKMTCPKLTNGTLNFYTDKEIENRLARL